MKLSRSNKVKNIFLATLITSTVIFTAGAAQAALSLSYGVNGGGLSSVVYDPSVDGLLHGNNISVTTVTGTETLHAGSHAVSNGLLNFQTGAFTGSSSPGQWNFGGGGTISITGGISDASISNTTLLTGSFLSASVTQLDLNIFKFDIVGSTFGDTDNPLVYAYFGIPAGSTCSNAMSLSFLATQIGATGFTNGSNTIAGQVVDSPTPTPIPAAAWLLGSGLMGLAGMKKRKQI